MKQVFIRRKKNTVSVDGHMGGFGGESRPSGSLNHFYGIFFHLGVLWLIILICLVENPYQEYFRILLCMHAHLSGKMDSTKEVYG